MKTQSIFSNPKIFIVEDDLFYQEIILNELKIQKRQNIEVFENGEQCLNHLYKKPGHCSARLQLRKQA